MATIKELYDLCKKKQKAGEKLGFLLKAFVEEYENCLLYTSDAADES